MKPEANDNAQELAKQITTYCDEFDFSKSKLADKRPETNFDEVQAAVKAQKIGSQLTTRFQLYLSLRNVNVSSVYYL